MVPPELLPSLRVVEPTSPRDPWIWLWQLSEGSWGKGSFLGLPLWLY